MSPTGEPQSQVPGGTPGPQPSKPGSNKTLIIIIAVVVGLALLGAGCKLIVGKMVGFGMKKAIEAGTGVSVDEKKDGSSTITFKGSDGQTVEVQGEGDGEVKTLPKKFPSDFPIMGNMTLESTYSLSADGTDSFTLQWSTNATTEAVGEFYKNALEKEGWRITATTELNDQLYLSFERGPEDAPSDKKESGWITAGAAENGGTTVGLFLTKPAA